MKSFFPTLNLLSLSAILLLSSCNIEMTKRLYSSGYYVDWNWKRAAKTKVGKKELHVPAKVERVEVTVIPDSNYTTVIKAPTNISSSFSENSLIATPQRAVKSIIPIPDILAPVYSIKTLINKSPSSKKPSSEYSTLDLISFTTGTIALLLLPIFLASIAGSIPGDELGPVILIIIVLLLSLTLEAVALTYGSQSLKDKKKNKESKNGNGLAILGIIFGSIVMASLLLLLFSITFF